MSRTTFNADLARQVLTYIREHPEQHEQATYVEPTRESGLAMHADAEDVLKVAEGVKPTEGQYQCMTTACIAGWAVLLAGPKATRAAYAKITRDDKNNEPWFETGRRLLGMTRAEAQAVFLEFEEEEALERLRKMIETAEGND